MAAFDPKRTLAVSNTVRRIPPMALLIIALFGTAAVAQDDLARVSIFPGTWAVAVSTWLAQPVDRREVRRVGCVGLEDKRMLCSWEQHIGGSWRIKFAWADLSTQGKPRILEAVDSGD